MTFHLEAEEPDIGPVLRYEEECQSQGEKLMWIVKPGENSNRGCGIEVCRKAEQVMVHIEKNR